MTTDKTSGFVINGEFVAPPAGVTMKNFCFDGEPQFKAKARKSSWPLQHFVLHETAGRTAAGCKKTLLKKGYGVHLILDRDGVLTCHGDLACDVMTHANQLNKTSIGIEVVNPYAPKIARGMEFDAIPAEWWTWIADKKDRRYVLPTAAQLITLERIVPFLCDKLGIPYEFPTAHLNRSNRKIKGWRIPPRKRPAPGVVAHQDFGKHADGRYLLEHLMKAHLSI